jgi:hypothetical protein
MSEEPKKSKKRKGPLTVRPSRQAERLAAFERGVAVRKVSEKIPDVVLAPPPAPIIPEPSRPLPLPPPLPPPVETRTQGEIDYAKIFDELDHRRAGERVPEKAEVEPPLAVTPADLERAAFEARGRELPPIQEFFEPPAVVLPPPPERLPRGIKRALDVWERDEFRRFERLNTDSLKRSLRALGHEHAIINGTRVEVPRYSEHYRVKHGHAMNEIEEYYGRKLLAGGIDFDSLRNLLIAIPAAPDGSGVFNPYEVDHMVRHMTAFWVHQRRVNSFERRGLSISNLSDVYAGVPKRKADADKERNLRLSEGRRE